MARGMFSIFGNKKSEDKPKVGGWMGGFWGGGGERPMSLSKQRGYGEKIGGHNFKTVHLKMRPQLQNCAP